MNPTEAIVRTEDLSKTFPGGVVAVNGLDMAVPAGSVYGLIGRNGAGKTTALRMLMGLLRADNGSATILGRDFWNAPREIKQDVAYVSQTQRLYAWMALSELCRFAAHFYRRWDEAYAKRLIAVFELAADRQIGLMSGGEQRKAAMVLALAAKPRALLLDEPAAGLDPVARRQLADEIIQFVSDESERTVLFSTHIISDLERVADYVGIMDRGRIVTQGKLEELLTGTKRVQIVFDADHVPGDFKIPNAVRVKVEGPVLNAVVRMIGDGQIEAFRKIPGARVNVYPIGLEDIFIELFGPEAREEMMEAR